MTEIFLLAWAFVSAADGDTLIVRDGSLDPLKPPHQPLALIAAGTNRYPHVRPRLLLNTFQRRVVSAKQRPLIRFALPFFLRRFHD